MRERVAKPKKASTSSFSIPKLRQPTRGFGLNSSGILRQTTADFPYLNKPLGHDISRISLHQPTQITANQPEDVEEQETQTLAPQMIQEMNEPENHQTVQREELPEEEERRAAEFKSQELEQEELQMKPLDSSPQAITQEQAVNEPVTHDITRMSLRVQTKLTINQPGDIYEQQADTVARQVMQKISQPQNQQFIQHEALPETELQRKFLVGSAIPAVQRQGGGVAKTSNLETSIQQARQNGQPLSDNIRQPMEEAFGADFSSVKIHTDSCSHELNQTIQARAFTTGQDIFFRQGEYNPQSYQGKELLAHELTHVVQQNGNAIGRQTDSSPTAAVTPDIDIQRVCCSQCEEEEELLQAKELPGHTIQLAPDVNERVSQQTTEPDVTEVENDVRQELDNNRARQASLGVQSPLAAGTTEPPPDENPKTQPESGKNATDSNSSVEMAAPEDETQQDKPNEDVEAGVAEAVSPEKDADKGDDVKDKDKAVKAGMAEAVSPEMNADKGEDVKDKDKAVKAGMAEAVSQKKKDEDEEKASESEAAETGGVNPQGMEQAASPETKAVQGEQIAQQANAVRGAGLEKLPPQLNNQNPESMAQAVTPETVAEKKQATTEVLAAQAQQNAVNAQTSQLAATEVNFAPPEQETAEGDDDAIFQEQQKAEAINITNSFLAEAALRVQTITQLGQGIEARIQGSTENAKASVMAVVEQQKATVTAQIAQQREQVQSQAQAIIAQIQTQYQTAAATTSQTAATERQKVAAEYTTSVQKVDETESNQLAKIEEFYTQAKEKYRAAGVKVGDEAIAFGEQKAAEWEAQITGKDDNFWDGPLTDNRLKARAKAARDVAQQYKDGLVEEGNKQADAVEQGKPKDIEGIHNAANQSRQQLQTLQQQTLDNLNSVEQQVLTQLADAQTQLTQTANQTLQSTLQTLDQQQTAQLQLLSVYGNGQVSAIERDAQKAIASIQDGINQAAASLQTAIQDTQTQLEGTPAPNPEELSATLAEILAQFDSSVAKVQEQTEQGITASQEGIAQGGQQAVTAVNGIGQSGLEESAAVSQEAKTSLTNLNQGATDTFNQIQQAFTTTVTNTTQAALTGFGQVTQGIQSAFDQSNQNMETNFQKSVNDLEEGLRGSIQGDKQPNLDSDIQKYAQEAADQEQPRWKTVLKVLLVIAVIVVAIIVAPAVIGAVGALAGALGAGAALAGGIGAVVGGAIVGAVAGAVIQMGNNVIDGKNLLDGVGKAALAGAIGGALGGAGGVFGNMLAQAGRLGTGLTQSFLKFGIDVAFDIAGGIFGNLATGEPITLEAVLIGAAIGAAVQISTANLGRLGRFGRSVQGMQTRTFQAGEQFGTSLGNGIKTGFGGKVDTPSVSSPDVDVPGGKPPETETAKGDRSEVNTLSGSKPDINTPGVKEPEVEVKSPQTDVPGRTAHIDEPEIEPGVVAKQTAIDGHEIKVLKDGRIVRCSDCGEIRNKYQELLDSNPELTKELNTIEGIRNPDEKAAKAREFEQKLQETAGKRKREPDATEGEPSKRTKWESPLAQTNKDRYEKMVEERGSDAMELDHRPHNWTGKEEAEFRGYPPAEEGYLWRIDNNQLNYVRKSVAMPGGKTRPPRAYDEASGKFVDVDTNVIRANYKVDGSDTMKIPDERAEYDQPLKVREDARSRRDELLDGQKDIGSWREKIAPRRAELEKLKQEHPDQFTTEKEAELNQINQQEAELKTTLNKINEQSRKLGEKAAEDYVKSKYPGAELQYGGPTASSQSGDFDQVWRVPEAGANGKDLWIVVEAKGGSSSLGTRKLKEQRAQAQQGSKAYFDEIVGLMSVNKDSKNVGRQLGEAVEDSIGNVKYLEVRARITSDIPGKAQLQDIKIKEFDISS